ncbi:MAG: DHH family phosphoesterase [Oscillospiraceae bacterium]|nr:DHH family phosphoesterase [Oscillospiraceae bacterium]
MILLLLTALLLMALLIYSAFKMYQYDENDSFVFIAATIVLAFLASAQIIRMKQNLYRYFNRLEHGLEQTKCFTLFYSPDPIAIVDSGGKIVWYNQTFLEEISNNTDAFGIDICEELDFSEENLKSDGDFEINYQQKYYRLNCSINYDYNIELKIIFFRDITDYRLLHDKYTRTKPTVALIHIDNYEDLFKAAKESERSSTLASIEELFENFMTNSNSFLKRLSKDKFLIVFEEQHLQQLLANRFEILDKARAIRVSEDTYVTLSIGVGHESSSLSESEALARQALDMALGRGGDQAAVKTKEGFSFYGGMSKGIEKHSRIKTRIISNALQKLMENASNIFIMGHRFGDLDSVGSAIGLSAAVNSIGMTSYVVVHPEKNLAKDMIEKVRSNTDMCVFVDEKQALELIDENSLLIIVDTHKRDMVDSIAVFEKIHNVVVIDHHRKNVNFIESPVLFFHEPFASSAAEMVTELLPYFRNFSKIPVCTAEALLAGIMLDTKNFIVKTASRTFEAAAYLKKLGADTVSVRSYFSNSIDSYKIKADVVSKAEINDRCAIAIAEDENCTDNELRVIAPQSADELLSICGVDAAFVIYEINKTINISARSYGRINVQLVMEKLNGGGHQTMAATQLKNISVKEAHAKLIEAINIYNIENMSTVKNDIPTN